MTKVTVTRRSEVEIPRNVAARRDSRPGLTAAGIKAYDEMSMEELRAKCEEQLRDDGWKKNGPQVCERIVAVLQRYPHYKDTKKNGELIAAKLSTPEAIQERRSQHRQDNDYSLLEIAGAIEEMLAQGQLDVNEAEAQSQRIAGYREQLASVPSTEDELYQMPMHELRRRSTPGIYDPLGPK